MPVGAVVVLDDKVLCATRNEMEATGDPTQHAELLAIRQAVSAVGRHQLPACVLYVTLEPCPMCAGALLQARIGRVVYGARNPLLGQTRQAQTPSCLWILQRRTVFLDLPRRQWWRVSS